MHTDDIPDFEVSLAPASARERRMSRLRRNVWVAGRLHSLSDGCTGWLVTLTYRDPDSWQPRHVSEAIRRFRYWARRSGVRVRYLWVAEIQAARARRTGHHVLHYHLFLLLPPGVSMPYWDRPVGRALPFWPHGLTKVERVRDNGRMSAYLMKYLSKGDDEARFPPGCRVFGVGGLGDLACVRSWFNLPGWLRGAVACGRWRRFRGGFVEADSGEVQQNPFARVVTRAAILFYRRFAPPEPVACGPWSHFIAYG